MAEPEQIAAEKLDQRSDVFALGILLYELATGKRLFEGETDLQVLKKIADESVAPPSSVWQRKGFGTKETQVTPTG